MAKFCGKCGAKLDETTGLCPNCDAEKIKEQETNASGASEDLSRIQNQEDTHPILNEKEQKKEAKIANKKAKKAQKKAAKKEKRAQWSTGKKIRHFLLKLVLTLLLLVIVVGGVTGALVYFDVVRLPIVSALLESFEIISAKEINDASIGTLYTPDEESLTIDEDTGTVYINNIVILFFNKGTSQQQIDEVVASIDGEIVGSLPAIDQYQVKVGPHTLPELVAICETLKSNDCVFDAIYDQAVEIQSDVEPDDPWTKTWFNQGENWSAENPDGANWWLEAVEAMSAWDYQSDFDKIKIGVVDNGFDSGHEDLKNVIAYTSSVNNKEEHGTHVAGIIGAEANNAKGITGLVWDCQLYTHDWELNIGQKVVDYLFDTQWSTFNQILGGTVQLIEQGAEVINLSAGQTEAMSSTTRSDDEVNYNGYYASLYLHALLERGYDFVIVQSAGNGNENDISVDAKYNGLFCSITPENCVTCDTIGVDDIMGRIVVVGAAQNDGNNSFSQPSWSNAGERVDICAPGKNIYSTIPGGWSGKYGYLSGTSMAAPIVTGIASLVWATNPDLSGKDVKSIICDEKNTNRVVLDNTTEEHPLSNNYNLINARLAVEAARNYVPDNTDGQFVSSDVPEDAVEFNGHYYCAYLANTAANWELAAQFCEEQGGYLATITSQEENDFLLSYIHQKGFTEAYFGLSKSENEDKWEWITQEQLDYTNWGDGQDGRYARLFGERTQAGINHIEASSELNEGTSSYAASLIEDGDLRTAWVEGTDGQGVGESISLTFDQAYQISGLEIYAGYQKSEDLYYKNSRPETITVGFSDGTSAQYTLQDVNEKQTVSFPTAVETDRLTVRIDSVYAGSKYTDTAISELVPIAYEQDGGAWEPGNYAGAAAESTTAFICEWGEYQSTLNAQPQDPVRTTSDERDIVLVLDASGSMSGTPMEETKNAATKFIDTVLEEDASIGIVTYEDSAEQLSDFSVDKNHLTETVANISAGGGTNIESGLAEAKSMLDSSNAKKKIIVLMSDGEPNRGKEGEELIAYSDGIKSDDILIYTLGFFEDLGGSKSSAQYLMEHLASDGCHYEVASADDLVFFFEDMADQINGQKYIYIRIACPVDVTVTYNGETLCSAEDDLNVRTDFGTLSFEDSENVTDANEDDRIKVLRLKEGADYNVQIVGTGRGIMDYTVGFMDENGDYSDFRRFENVKITKETVIDTVAAVSDESVLNIDEDGDGKYDLKLRAEENGYGEEVKTSVWIYVSICGGAALLIILALIIVKIRRGKKKGKVNS